MSSRKSKRKPSKSRGAAQREAAAPLRPSDAEVRAGVERTEAWAGTVKVGLISLAIPASLLTLYPTAKAVAGLTTHFDFSMTVSITLSLALAVTNAGTYAWGRHHNRRANDAADQVTSLEARVGPMHDELDSLRKRNDDLVGDLERVRSLRQDE